MYVVVIAGTGFVKKLPTKNDFIGSRFLLVQMRGLEPPRPEGH